jgi:hypothetical protein
LKTRRIRLWCGDERSRGRFRGNRWLCGVLQRRGVLSLRGRRLRIRGFAHVLFLFLGLRFRLNLLPNTNLVPKSNQNVGLRERGLGYPSSSTFSSLFFLPLFSFRDGLFDTSFRFRGRRRRFNLGLFVFRRGVPFILLSPSAQVP